MTWCLDVKSFYHERVWWQDKFEQTSPLSTIRKRSQATASFSPLPCCKLVWHCQPFYALAFLLFGSFHCKRVWWLMHTSLVWAATIVAAPIRSQQFVLIQLAFLVCDVYQNGGWFWWHCVINTVHKFRYSSLTNEEVEVISWTWAEKSWFFSQVQLSKNIAIKKQQLLLACCKCFFYWWHSEFHSNSLHTIKLQTWCNCGRFFCAFNYIPISRVKYA